MNCVSSVVIAVLKEVATDVLFNLIFDNDGDYQILSAFKCSSCQLGKTYCANFNKSKTSITFSVPFIVGLIKSDLRRQKANLQQSEVRTVSVSTSVCATGSQRWVSLLLCGPHTAAGMHRGSAA